MYVIAEVADKVGMPAWCLVVVVMLALGLAAGAWGADWRVGLFALFPLAYWNLLTVGDLFEPSVGQAIRNEGLVGRIVAQSVAGSAPMLAVLVVAFTARPHQRQMARIAAGLCPRCGYNLTGIGPPRRCPECGEPPARERLTPPLP